jgi:hypothetical protein
MPDITRTQVIEAMTDTIGMEVTRVYVRSMHKDRAREVAQAAITAIEALGFKLVPMEPTFDMQSAGARVTYSETAHRVYAAMISASPLYKEPSNG